MHRDRTRGWLVRCTLNRLLRLNLLLGRQAFLHLRLRLRPRRRFQLQIRLWPARWFRLRRRLRRRRRLPPPGIASYRRKK